MVELGVTRSLLRRLSRAVACGLLASACAVSSTAPSPAPIDTTAPTAATSATLGLESNLSFCTDEINRYRTGAGLAALRRAGDLDAFAARAAEHDGRGGVPHEYFRRTNGGGVAKAETQLLRWRGYSVEDAIRRGLADMWSEAPSGTHYRVLTGRYAQVGCGVFADEHGISVSQAFR